MKRTVLVIPAVLLVAGLLSPAAHSGEVPASGLLPIEVVIDPPAPVQGDDVTLTVTAEVPDLPECSEVGILVIDSPTFEFGPVAGTIVTPVDGVAIGTLTITSAFPGEYGVLAACIDAEVADLTELPNPFTVTVHPDFVLAADPSSGVVGTAGAVTVSGGGCPGATAVTKLVAPGTSLDLYDQTAEAVEVADDGSWAAELTWQADQPAGAYEIAAICTTAPSRPFRGEAYESIAFTLTAPAAEPPPPPLSPATPIPAPADFTG